MPGAQCARSLACTIDKAHERSHHGHTGTTRHSLRNGFNGYFALSRVTGLFATLAQRTFSAKLDASIGASGPHDFAVRLGTFVNRATSVHRIPFPTSVTIASRPSLGNETGRTGH
jgi:hypothetical protein